MRFKPPREVKAIHAKGAGDVLLGVFVGLYPRFKQNPIEPLKVAVSMATLHVERVNYSVPVTTKSGSISEERQNRKSRLTLTELKEAALF
uniref:Carbohydrate kinase PfkB domain-containing protein n=1 Tax=Fervidicoccus fontis TaxID=683846 RepID=A0A7J3ZL36_9CREN